MHRIRAQVPTWANDSGEGSEIEKKKQEKKKALSNDYLNFDSDESEMSGAEDVEVTSEGGDKGDEPGG